jgi:SAM-dependent methyltransferase
MATLEDASPHPVSAAIGRPAFRLSPVQEVHRAAVLAKLATGEFTFEEVATCVCGASEAVSVAREDRFGIPVGVVACAACGLLRTSPRLAEAHLSAFYEIDYHGLHFGVERPDVRTVLVRRGQGAAIYAYCRSDLPRRAGRPIRVVEIGAGSGAVLRELQAAAAADGVQVEATGCEYSAVYAEAARGMGTDVRAGGIEALLDIGLQPDLLVMSHVLEHFADPTRDLELVHRLVGPETVVYVEVPGLLTIHHKPQYDYRFGQYLTLAHTYHFTLDTLTDTMERVGFHRLRGDEEVRGLFALAADGSPPSPGVQRGSAIERAARLPRLLAYLDALERSPRLRARRTLLRTRRTARRAASGAARALLGERGTRAVKRLIGRR